MSTETRGYVVGLPVVVTVENSGFVQVEVDLSELPSSIWESTHEPTFPEPDEDTIARDQQVLERWIEHHSVKNEGYDNNEVLVMVLDDGTTLLVCPICEAENQISELDVSERWSDLAPREDGGFNVLMDNHGDTDSKGFVCKSCSNNVSLIDADETELVDYV